MRVRGKGEPPSAMYPVARNNCHSTWDDDAASSPRPRPIFPLYAPFSSSPLFSLAQRSLLSPRERRLFSAPQPRLSPVLLPAIRPPARSPCLSDESAAAITSSSASSAGSFVAAFRAMRFELGFYRPRSIAMKGRKSKGWREKRRMLKYHGRYARDIKKFHISRKIFKLPVPPLRAPDSI